MMISDLGVSPRPDTDVVSLLESIFADHRARRPAPSVDVTLDRELWDRLDGLGLTRLTGDDARGGSGASWLEASALLGLAAGAAAAVPLTEHDLLGGWLLEAAGLPEQAGIRTTCQPDPTGVAIGVPWGRDAAAVVALWQSGDGWKVADVPRDRLQVSEARDLAGEPRDTVAFPLVDLEAGRSVGDEIAAEYRLRGALARCAQVAGGMSAVVGVVLQHVNARIQFGRQIGKFQAVQNLVADLAAEAALAQAATDAAVARAVTYGWSDEGTSFAVAVAKSCTGHAASVVVRNAHQALGAIGATLEHELPRLTKPILARRREFGSVHEWDALLGSLAASAGRDGLWDLITSTRPPAAP